MGLSSSSISIMPQEQKSKCTTSSFLLHLESITSTSLIYSSKKSCACSLSSNIKIFGGLIVMDVNLNFAASSSK